MIKVNIPRGDLVGFMIQEIQRLSPAELLTLRKAIAQQLRKASRPATQAPELIRSERDKQARRQVNAAKTQALQVALKGK